MLDRQVLWGCAEGTSPPTLCGTDGEPLIITPAGGRDARSATAEKICTRPFAVDLDDDGDLDLVVGNFGGTFAMFAGEGEGRFVHTDVTGFVCWFRRK